LTDIDIFATLETSTSVDGTKGTLVTLLASAPTTRRHAALDTLPVAIIGAGPVGLAAAAHLLERGIDVVVFEAGGDIAHNVAAWGHTRLFSPWRHLVDPAARRMLEDAGWVAPDPDDLPTGAELIDVYLRPLAALAPIASRIRFGSDVVAVSRLGMDRTRSTGRADVPFVLRTRDQDGSLAELTARAVIDASGTSHSSNSLSSDGLDPVGLPDVADRVSGALPDVLGRDRARFAGRRTVVVGAGHSAANTLLALAGLAAEDPSTTVVWAVRNDVAARVSDSADDELAARASIGARVRALVASGAIELITRFELVRLGRTESDDVVLIGSRDGELTEIRADQVVNATGFRPRLDMLREIRLELDEVVEAPRRLAPLIDPNLHSCGTVKPHGFVELAHPEPSFFIAGMKSYGRAPTFLLATGYEQVRSIAAWIAGDYRAAREVQLVLPATGVCSTSAATADAKGCCS
jgi:thioredoxin reductase